MHGLGYADRFLSGDMAETTRVALAKQNLDGRRVLVIISDGSRGAPIPQTVRLLHEELAGRVAARYFLIALGTQRPMSQEQIDKLVRVSPEEWEKTFADVNVFSHQWWDPETFVCLRTISADQVEDGTTPVKKLFDLAAAMISMPQLCFALVVAPTGNRLAGLYVDTPEAAWSKAAELSARVHIDYVVVPSGECYRSCRSVTATRRWGPRACTSWSRRWPMVERQ